MWKLIQTFWLFPSPDLPVKFLGNLPLVPARTTSWATGFTCLFVIEITIITYSAAGRGFFRLTPSQVRPLWQQSCVFSQPEHLVVPPMNIGRNGDNPRRIATEPAVSTKSNVSLITPSNLAICPFGQFPEPLNSCFWQFSPVLSLIWGRECSGKWGWRTVRMRLPLPTNTKLGHLGVLLGHQLVRLKISK